MTRTGLIAIAAFGNKTIFGSDLLPRDNWRRAVTRASGRRETGANFARRETGPRIVIRRRLTRSERYHHVLHLLRVQEDDAGRR